MAKISKQSEDFPSWYGDVIREAGMAEHGAARGTMVIKPWGFGLWENMQAALDSRIKATGHENLYFPMFIPQHMLEKEAEHVEGFAPEFAVVTHGGGAELDEPLVIRPTSETIIWTTYGKWIQSYRDLPLLYNQWCNVVRWEMRTRLFLRTTEFLWQEGHTAHATSEEAAEETLQMLEVYREVAEDELAIPVLPGRKTDLEKFPGAVTTYTIEGLMRDGKALQCGTSHYLGQNFSEAYDVQFLNSNGEQEYAWGTSWGFSTRMVGATIMAHGDDKGLRLPPRIAPTQVVIVPIYRSEEEKASVLEVAERVHASLTGNGVRVRVDDRDQYRPGHKFNEWELKGVPLRVELGPRDIANDCLVLANRITGDKETVSIADAVSSMAERLTGCQQALYDDALSFRQANTHEVDDLGALREGIESQAGFWVGPWCGDETCEQKVAEQAKASIRFIPLESQDPDGPCIVCAKPGRQRATWARAY